MTATAARPATASRSGAAPQPTAPSGRMPAAVSETALLALHLSVVFGFVRLYEDTSFAWPLVAFVVGAHSLAVICRRRRVPAPIVALIAVVGAALAASWLLFPGSTRLGLPTHETWDLATAALRTSRAQFDQVAAPAPVTPGFQLTSGLALWGSVWFADWAAFRLRATIEAVAPPTVLFVFCAMLGSGEHRFSSALVFTGAVLVFVAGHRALRSQLDQAWLTTSPITGPRAILRAGAALAVVGLVTGAVVGPRLPGSESEALVRWRTESADRGDRTTVSPIVDLRKRLVNQGNTELFRVTADRRAYWRLTALEQFDGRLWTTDSPSDEAGQDLDSVGPEVSDTRRNVQRIEVQDLSAIWVPAAFQARSLTRSTERLRWLPDSSTLVVDDPEASGDEVTSDGLKLTVVSESPVIDAEELRAARGRDPSAIEERYEGLPSGFPVEARQAATDAVAGARGRYEQAIALQNWFRDNFEYSLDVPAGHSDDDMLAFLASRSGYCEQFAGTYAAMARSLGIPSRVAIGFTPGDRVEDDPNTFQVRGRHAHAWPELWFPGVGWVPFEPTPGRGMPDAQAYTGLNEQQAGQGTINEPTTPTSTTTTQPGAATTTPGSTVPATTVPRATVATGGPEDPTTGASSNPALRLAGALLAVGLAWVALVLLTPVVRARRRRPSGQAAATVLDAWQAGLAPVRWTTGLHPRAAETHDEFSRRAAPPLGELGAPFRELAALATSAAWDPAGASGSAAERAEALAQDLRTEGNRRQGRLARIRRLLSWREAFGRPSHSS